MRQLPGVALGELSKVLTEFVMLHSDQESCDYA